MAIELLAQVQEAADFLDNLAYSSPILAFAGFMFAAMLWALVVQSRENRTAFDRQAEENRKVIERITANFATVMDSMSERQHEISQKRLESSNQLTSMLSRLATLIEQLHRD